jgi:hypothetical protein
METQTWVILVLLILSAGGVGTFFWLHRPKKKEAVLYTRCPRCCTKLKYLEHQAGRQARCGSCKLDFDLPGAVNANIPP